LKHSVSNDEPFRLIDNWRYQSGIIFFGSTRNYFQSNNKTVHPAAVTAADERFDGKFSELPF